jgi:hypothetical protein
MWDAGETMPSQTEQDDALSLRSVRSRAALKAAIDRQFLAIHCVRPLAKNPAGVNRLVKLG